MDCLLRGQHGAADGAVTALAETGLRFCRRDGGVGDGGVSEWKNIADHLGLRDEVAAFEVPGSVCGLSVRSAGRRLGNFAACCYCFRFSMRAVPAANSSGGNTIICGGPSVCGRIPAVTMWWYIGQHFGL